MTIRDLKIGQKGRIESVGGEGCSGCAAKRKS